MQKRFARDDTRRYADKCLWIHRPIDFLNMVSNEQSGMDMLKFIQITTKTNQIARSPVGLSLLFLLRSIPSNGELQCRSSRFFILSVPHLQGGLKSMTFWNHVCPDKTSSSSTAVRSFVLPLSFEGESRFPVLREQFVVRPRSGASSSESYVHSPGYHGNRK